MPLSDAKLNGNKKYPLLRLLELDSEDGDDKLDEVVSISELEVDLEDLVLTDEELGDDWLVVLLLDWEEEVALDGLALDKEEELILDKLELGVLELEELKEDDVDDELEVTDMVCEDDGEDKLELLD